MRPLYIQTPRDWNREFLEGTVLGVTCFRASPLVAVSYEDMQSVYLASITRFTHTAERVA